jgi:hypothetical protein
MSWALQWLPARLATHCGSPLLYDSQWVREGWSDSPRPVTIKEWLELMSAWHRLLHAGSPEARSKNWPVAPPSIWRFSESFDLPVGDWAIENARLHGWTEMLVLAERQAQRNAFLCTLAPETRRHLYETRRWMKRLKRDRYWASRGYVQTSPATWTMGRRLLMDRLTAESLAAQVGDD